VGGGEQAPPLSVVVAVHDVARWLPACLDSVAASVPEGSEVILVDDGSSDSSGAICDDAVARHDGWRVVHQANAGLGAARNVGIDAARGRYLGFVDGDDLLLPTYASLTGLAVASGANVATGAVMRTDGVRTWPSGLHTRALQGLRSRATLAGDTSLVYDTTAWNKVYRLDFLREQGLRFPEGVLYEDLPLTVRALHLAGEVAVLHEPVYVWRARQGERSITQRRNEIRNLTERFKAVLDVDTFLEHSGLDGVQAAHDDKVLRLDLPLYTAALPESDAEYRAAYLEFFRHLVSALPAQRREGLPPTLRLYVELADRGRMDDLVTVVRARRGERAWAAEGRGRLGRVRDSLASFAVERGLGLSSDAELVRRAGTSTVKILLPADVRDVVTRLLRRRRAGR
jgi:CDP-glycerol glycerophosphotransferase